MTQIHAEAGVLEGQQDGIPVPANDPLALPAFLIIDAETRAKAWRGRRLTDSRSGGYVDEKLARSRELDRQHRELESAKKRGALAALKAGHEGERYDRKARQWVKVTAAVTKRTRPGEVPAGFSDLWKTEGFE